MNDGPGREEEAERALLSTLLADPSTWAEPSADLEAAVVRAVMSAAPTQSAPSIANRREPASRFRPSRLVAVAAAAAVVVALGFGAVTALGRGSTDFSGRLSATSLAPGAYAQAKITHNDAGFRIALDAHGLPVLKPGEYYEAWLKNNAGELVAIGTFSSSDARVTLWSGVSPREFSTLSVTIEKVDANEDSSGMRVLVGPLTSD
jgi:Anti-sigma-K factor rskA